METVIRLRLSELTEETISRVKKIISSAVNNADPEINILVDLEGEDHDSYFSKLDDSIKQLERGEVTSFTMEEFEAYAHKLAGE